MAVLILLSRVSALHSLLPAFTLLTQLVAYLLLWSIFLTVIALWMVIDFKFFQVPVLPQQTGEHTFPGLLPSENHIQNFSEGEKYIENFS